MLRTLPCSVEEKSEQNKRWIYANNTPRLSVAMEYVTFCMSILVWTAAMGKMQTRRPSPEEMSAAEEFIEQAMGCAGMLGLALTVTDQNGSILEKGFGFADLHGERKITPRTQFPIASNSKAFTSTLLAMLIDEGIPEGNRYLWFSVWW